jgi:hypothetical protein
VAEIQKITVISHLQSHIQTPPQRSNVANEFTFRYLSVVSQRFATFNSLEEPMKKLKLDLDQIQVVSFRVKMSGGSSGTVNAFSVNSAIGCGTWDCTNDLNSCGSCHPHDCPVEPITWGC